MSTLWQTRLPIASLVACTLLGLCGCGQKGALYLPDPAPQTVPATASQPAPATAPPAAEQATRGKAPRLPDPAKSQ